MSDQEIVKAVLEVKALTDEDGVAAVERMTERFGFDAAEFCAVAEAQAASNGDCATGFLNGFLTACQMLSNREAKVR